jgi:hypothetical protein
VKGVLLLDSMYGSAEPFVSFSRRADAPFVSVMYGSSTAGHTDEFRKEGAKRNSVIKPSPAAHDVLVQTALGDVLQTLSVDGEGVRLAGTKNKVTAPAPKAPAR